MLMIVILSLLSLITLVFVYFLRKQLLSFSQYNPWASKLPSQDSWISVIKTLLFWLVILPLSYLELIVEGILYTQPKKSFPKNKSVGMDQPTQNNQVNCLNGAKL